MEEIRFFVTREDYWHFNLFALFRRSRTLAGTLAALVLCVLVVIIVYQILFPHQILPPVLFAVLFPILLGFRMWLSYTRGFRALQKGGATFVTITPQHMQVKNENVDSKVSWRMIKAIFQDKYSFYFQIENPTSKMFRAFIVPRHAFASPEEAERFFAQARGYWSEQSGQVAVAQG